MVIKNSKLTHSGIRHQGNSWKGAGHIQGVGEVTGNRASARKTSISQAAALFPLGTSTGAAAGRAPVAHGEKLKCLASG